MRTPGKKCTGSRNRKKWTGRATDLKRTQVKTAAITAPSSSSSSSSCSWRRRPDAGRQRLGFRYRVETGKREAAGEADEHGHRQGQWRGRGRERGGFMMGDEGDGGSSGDGEHAAAAAGVLSLARRR